MERRPATQPRPPAARVRAREMLQAEECPTAVQGAAVNVVDLGDGVALEFLADDPAEIASVRDRAYALASRHQRAVMEAQARGEAGARPQRGMKQRETMEPRDLELEDEGMQHEGMQHEGMQERELEQEPGAMQQPQAMQPAERAGRTDEELRRAGAELSPLPSSHVAIVDVDRGVRLIFVPVERDDLAELRQELRARAARIEDGTCPANLMSMSMPNGGEAG
jgi:hypothetical protein